MSGSNSKSSTSSGELTSGSSSSTIQRPLNPILAPSKLSFGVSGGTLGEKASSISSSGSGLTFAPSTKLAFPGLKASKLSSVTQSVCSNSKALDENKQPPVAKAANFIPLTKESSTKLGETNPLPTSSVSPTATECVQETEAASSGAKASSSSFVFGQNLNDRAANFLSSNGSTKKLDTSEEQVDNTNSESTGGDVIPAATVSNSDKAPKSLTESAAEYCESRSKKVELTEVDLITGEESEANVCQMNAKLYLFDKSTSTWVERGRGQLRLNDLRPNLTSGDENQGPTSRLIMRTAGSLRVILNSKIFPEMTVEKPTEKNVRLTAMDDQNPGLRVFLVSGSPKDIRTLYVALTHRVENLKLSTTSSPKKDETSGTAKRKLDDNDTPNDESPPAEKEPKVA